MSFFKICVAGYDLGFKNRAVQKVKAAAQKLIENVEMFSISRRATAWKVLPQAGRKANDLAEYFALSSYAVRGQ